MKFEKFLKNCGARGTVITTKSDGKFLKLANVLLAIPDGVNVLSNGAVIAPDYIEDILTATPSQQSSPTQSSRHRTQARPKLNAYFQTDLAVRSPLIIKRLVL